MQVRMWKVVEPTSEFLGVRVGSMVQSSCFGQPYNQIGQGKASSGTTKGNPDEGVQ